MMRLILPAIIILNILCNYYVSMSQSLDYKALSDSSAHYSKAGYYNEAAIYAEMALKDAGSKLDQKDSVYLKLLNKTISMYYTVGDYDKTIHYLAY